MKKDFINQFRKNTEHLDNPDKTVETPPLNQEIELAKDLINAYRSKYAEIDLNVLRNMIELKEVTSQKKSKHPDRAFTEIEQRLGEAESEETLRQERWRQKISCPDCGSKHIKQLPLNEQKKADHFKYQCQDCGKKFNETTGTPIEKTNLPLSTWMFCWYLLGCTDSLQYIAAKLNLDISVVEIMVRQMQKLFKANQPLTHFMSFEEWNLKHGKSYKQRIEHEIAKRQELHRGETAEAPKDTAEYRRQKQRARDPKAVNPQRPKPRNRSS